MNTFIDGRYLLTRINKNLIVVFYSNVSCVDYKYRCSYNIPPFIKCLSIVLFIKRRIAMRECVNVWCSWLLTTKNVRNQIPSRRVSSFCVPLKRPRPKLVFRRAFQPRGQNVRMRFRRSVRLFVCALPLTAFERPLEKGSHSFQVIQ